MVWLSELVKESVGMAEKFTFQFKETKDRAFLKKSTAIKGAAFLILLFCVFLIVNDLVLCHRLSEIKIKIYDELDKKQNESDFKIKKLDQRIDNDRKEIESNRKGIEKNVEVFEKNKAEIESRQDDMSNKTKKEIQEKVKDVRNEFENRLADLDTKQGNKIGKIKNDIKSDFKVFEAKQAELSNEIYDELVKKQNESDFEIEKLDQQIDNDKKIIESNMKRIESNAEEIVSDNQEIKSNKKSIESNVKEIDSDKKIIESNRKRIESNAEEFEKGKKEIENRQADMSNKLKKELREKVKEVGTEFRNRLADLDLKQSDNIGKIERETKSDLNGIENRRTEMSDKIEKQGDELDRLKKDVGRTGTYFFYKLTDVENFFYQRKDVYSPIFSVRDVAFYLNFEQQTENHVNYLEFFLIKHATNENVKTYCEVSLINMKGKKNKEFKFNHTFRAADGDLWGSRLLKQQELTYLGFVKKDALLIKAYLEVL